MSIISEMLKVSAAKQKISKAGTASSVAKTTGNARVDQYNEIARVRGADDAKLVAKRTAEKMAKAVSTGSNASASNPKPDQVDANGAITGGMADPKIGRGNVTPFASTGQNGWQSIQDFFANRTN